MFLAGNTNFRCKINAPVAVHKAQNFGQPPQQNSNNSDSGFRHPPGSARPGSTFGARIGTPEAVRIKWWQR
jgi:hypothetical protein